MKDNMGGAAHYTPHKITTEIHSNIPGRYIKYPTGARYVYLMYTMSHAFKYQTLWNTFHNMRREYESLPESDSIPTDQKEQGDS